MRYRGPFEYDKFILNVLQHHNEIVELCKKQNSSLQSLLTTQEDLNETYKRVVGSGTTTGLSESLYNNLLTMEG
jgi:hypothetical protein